ncbi:hypothetical protein [Mucilaginibacter panaciglaebae]|uniref:Uncharacterized protein n=1 Tax=Mucilaginibacter panaciglaebae TaxID=502331 RepID=A0ABP7X0A0_9SPHI
MQSNIHQILNPPPHEKQVLFAIDHKPYIDLRNKNIEVEKVYTNILSDLRQILAQLSFTASRTYLIQKYPNKGTLSQDLYEFVCLLCSVTLYKKNYCYRIVLETDSDIIKTVGEQAYSQVFRVAYRNTNYECTQHDLEDIITINTDKCDHYTYWKRRLTEDLNGDSLVAVEDANTDW